MFNVTGGELLILLVVALIVLGPDKLPDAVRRAGRLLGELRRMSDGFQAELKGALDEPTRELRATATQLRDGFRDPDTPVIHEVAPPTDEVAAADTGASDLADEGWDRGDAHGGPPDDTRPGTAG